MHNAAHIPLIEPAEFTAGDVVRWKKYLPEYSPADFSLAYYLQGPGKQMLTATADAVNSSWFSVEILSVATGAWKEGKYWWSSFVTDANNNRFPVDSGTLTVKPDPAQMPETVDGRSFAAKALAAIEAVILNRAGRAELSYQIEGRSLSMIPHEELLVMRDKLKAEVAREVNAEKIKRGERISKNIYVRFG
jgi:hypothetical protein